MCTCPFHANGKEHNPSCGVLLQQKVTKDKTYEAGTVHCYTCGYTADLPQFVADLLGLSSPVEGFKWLVNQYNYQTEERELPDLDMYRGSTAKSSVLEESLVKQYTQNLLQSEEACRYLHKRRIANWVLEAYELGFDPEDKTVSSTLRVDFISALHLRQDLQLLEPFTIITVSYRIRSISQRLRAVSMIRMLKSILQRMSRWRILLQTCSHLLQELSQPVDLHRTSLEQM